MVGIGHRLVPPSPAPRAPGLTGDNIHAHYDLSNEFFEIMLDETMMYSSALFARPGMSLADGQRAKLDRLCTKLDLGPDDHVLEIGTGWGGFAVHAASAYGCRVTTTTISDAEFRYAAKLVADAGLSDRVVVLDRDYRDVGGTYDKLVSIEMIEAVDWRQHDTFFRACASRLRSDGLMALQAITVDDRSYERAKNATDFIREMIFPGSCLPSVEAIDPLAAACHSTSRRRPRGHRATLRGDSAPLARQHRPTPARGHRPRTRHPVPAPLGPLPLLLRRGLCGAAHQRRPDDHGHARLGSTHEHPGLRHCPDGVRLPEGPERGDPVVLRTPVDVDPVHLDGRPTGEGDPDDPDVGCFVSAQE